MILPRFALVLFVDIILLPREIAVLPIGAWPNPETTNVNANRE